MADRPRGISVIGFAYVVWGILTSSTAMLWWIEDGWRATGITIPLFALILGVLLAGIGRGILHGDRIARMIAVAVAIGAIGQPIMGLGRMIAEMEWETFIGVMVPMIAISVANVAVLNYLLGDGAWKYFRA